MTFPTNPIHYVDIVAKGETIPNFTLVNDKLPISRVLPDPGVPVFIRVAPGHQYHNRIAAIREDDTSQFVLASYNSRTRLDKISVHDITGWDYAVPAGDML